MTAPLKQPKVPFFRPEISEEEIAAVAETLRSGWLTTGPRTRQFESNFAERVGAKHALAVNSATAALHLALNAAGIGPGDEVIVPTMTFTATAEVVVHQGAKPVFVDCLPDTMNMDPACVAAAVTSRTKAMVPVHYGGQPCEMDRLLEIAAQYDLWVVEDAAHALPAQYRGRTVGTIGDLTCFSFYANKTITTGEGGMLTTDDDELAERVRIRSLHGLSKDAWKRFSAEGSWYYEVVYPGFKYNLTDTAAALGLGQLSRADDFWRRRERCAARYCEQLADVPQIKLPRAQAHVQHSWHLFVIQLELEQLSIDRNAFIRQLDEAGIGTSVHYIPLHMQPYYRDTFGYRPDDFPVARGLYDRIITLPIYPSLPDESLQYVADTVRSIVAEHRR
ncbi:MAG: DegT/DnrJ/EryC1/StrS aminotransferase family protein [Pirellulales bacterium]|nr:DegT/DnrJ/EryC1/StrS aminotransferase family protein [Pirellulales bacterium]